MKILMVTNGLGIGGAETHIVELSKELMRRGNKVIICSSGGEYAKEAQSAGIEWVDAPLNRRSLVPMAKSLMILYRTIRREKPDIVHAHARIPGFLCGLLHRVMKFTFVTTAHWVFAVTKSTRLLTNWGEKTVAVSQDIKQYLIDNYGIAPENIYVTINGIDTKRFSPEISGERVRRELGIPMDATVISHVSRLGASRALAAEKLIESAPALAGSFPGIVILIAGGGDSFQRLSQAAERVNSSLGYNCIVMPGARTDVNEIVAAGQVFVGVSRAALEAMAGGKATVIAGNEGYIGTFTKDKFPIAVESNFCCRGCDDTTSERLTADLTELLGMSEADRDALGSYGRKVIMEHYSVKRMTDDTERAYMDALPGRKVVMSGYFGFDNTGDEAILKSVYNSVRENIPGAKITVLSSSPEKTASAYGCMAADRFSPGAVFKAIKGCDTFVFGGGSLLQDTTSTRSLMYYLTVLRLAERLGKKTMIFANGIGPITSPKSRRKTAAAVEKATAVTLRDPKSAQELRDMGVRRKDLTVTADPALLLKPGKPEDGLKLLCGADVSGGFFTVALRHWKNDVFLSTVGDACRKIKEGYNLTPVFISMQQDVDKSANEIAAERVPGGIFVGGSVTPEELMALIGQSRFIIAMRLHALIFAANSGTPAIGISYDPKLDA